MPESQFWREMNPAKLTALYDAQFGIIREGETDMPRQVPKQEQKQSLREYMRGG